jgi:hypothetical protein
MPFVNAALSRGYDQELKITEVTSDEMLDFKRGLFNAAKLLGCSLHCNAHKQTDGSYHLVFAVHSKTAGRKHILEKHGTDRTKWPYNPRRPSPRDPSGNRTDV